MLRGTGGREDISKVSRETLRMKRISLMTSITSSLVIDSLYKQANKEDIAVVILYCDYQEQHKQTTTNMVGSILKQLAAKDNIILESVRKAFLKAKDKCGGRGLRLLDLIEILKESAVLLPEVFICIDALDELMSKELPELLASLGCVQELPNVHVFLTGRPYVGTQISRHLAKVATVTISLRSHDIESYLQRKLKMDTAPYEMNDLLQADIKKYIKGSISKSFVQISTTHHNMHNYIFTNSHAQIPPCFAKHQCYSWGGYYPREKKKAEPDVTRQRFGGCLRDNSRTNERAGRSETSIRNESPHVGSIFGATIASKRAMSRVSGR